MGLNWKFWHRRGAPSAGEQTARGQAPGAGGDALLDMASAIGNSGMNDLLGGEAPQESTGEALDAAMQEKADNLIHGNKREAPPLPPRPSSQRTGANAAAQGVPQQTQQTQPDPEQPIPTQAPVPQEEQQENPAAQQGAQEFSKMANLRNELATAKKGGWDSNRADSDHYKAVAANVDRVVQIMNQPLTGDPKEDQAMFHQITSAYADLLAACQVYADPKRTVFTRRGRARRNIVRNLQKQAEQDFRHLRQYADRLPTMPPEQRPKTMVEGLGAARTRTITLKRGKKSDLKHVGGAVSYIGVINQGDLVGENTNGFFKETEVFDKTLNGTALNRSMCQQVGKRTPELQAVADAAMKLIEETGEIPSMFKDKNSPFKGTAEGRAFDSMMSVVQKSDTETRGNLPKMSGNTVGLSNRNVATSRLADLLGVGDLVAHSEKVELRDAEGGGSYTGNLMQKAKGEEASKILSDYYRDDVLASHSSIINDSGNSGFTFDFNQSKSTEDLVTPEFMQSLTSLQVLDNLAAQKDRHSSNYFVEKTADGKLGKVQGIDNDFSFGTESLQGKNSYEKVGTHGRNILNEEGELILPHMDAKLAQRIQELKEGDVRLMMADVLEPEAIDALVGRIQSVQRAIALEKEKNPHSDRFLENTEDWGNASVKENFKNARLKKLDSVESTYVGGFLGGSQKYIIDKQCKTFVDAAQEKVWAGLKGLGSQEEKLAYLEEQGATDLDFFKAHPELMTGEKKEFNHPVVQSSCKLIGINLARQDYQKAREQVLERRKQGA